MTNANMAATHMAAPRASTVARQLHRWLNRLILVAIPVQFYAAGLAIFGAATFSTHMMLGWLLIALSLLSVVVSVIARHPGGSGWNPLVIFLLFLLQPILAFAPRAQAPAVSALHAAMGLAIMFVTWETDRKLREPVTRA
jgi:uncharacterized membrane protein HdeD (DUF308 family)